jgi:sigma-B regulation protein RsbU (phosphoserine phosphatase)
VADISGKGVPAALLLSYTRSVFRLLASDTRSPAIIAARLSSALHEDTHGNPYVTGLIVRLDAEQARLTYVNAGHPPALLAAADGLKALDSGGPPMGLIERSSYVEGQVAVRPGDWGVLVTDGITESLDERQGGLDHLVTAIAKRLPNPVRAQAICDAGARRRAPRTGPSGARDWHDDRAVVTFVVR